jgi:hypothetical protein
MKRGRAMRILVIEDSAPTARCSSTPWPRQGTRCRPPPAPRPGEHWPWSSRSTSSSSTSCFRRERRRPVPGAAGGGDRDTHPVPHRQGRGRRPDPPGSTRGRRLPSQTVRGRGAQAPAGARPAPGPGWRRPRPVAGHAHRLHRPAARGAAGAGGLDGAGVDGARDAGCTRGARRLPDDLLENAWGDVSKAASDSLDVIMSRLRRKPTRRAARRAFAPCAAGLRVRGPAMRSRSLAGRLTLLQQRSSSRPPASWPSRRRRSGLRPDAGAVTRADSCSRVRATWRRTWTTSWPRTGPVRASQLGAA